MIRDEDAIRDILTQMETAWNRSDSQACAARFAGDATMIQIYGGQLDGRAAIEASHRHILDTIYRGSRARFTLRRIRYLHPNVAVAFAKAEVTYEDAGEPRVIETRPTLIVTRGPAGWEIAVFQNTRIVPMPAAAAAAARLAT